MDYLIYSLIAVIVTAILGLVAFAVGVKNSVKNVTENHYEERNFKVKKSLKMTGLFGIQFPDIKLYDLDRNEYGEIAEESPLYIEIVKSLAKEMVIDTTNPDFDVNKVFVKLGDKNSDSYKTYVHIMRCLTNVNFESFVGKGLRYDFSQFNRPVMREIESHVDAIIVEVGTYMIEQIIEMMDA